MLVDGHNIFIVTCVRECRKRLLFEVRSHGGLVKLFERHFLASKGIHCLRPGKGLFNLLLLPGMPHFHPSEDYVCYFLKAEI